MSGLILTLLRHKWVKKDEFVKIDLRPVALYLCDLYQHERWSSTKPPSPAFVCGVILISREESQHELVELDVRVWSFGISAAKSS